MRAPSRPPPPSRPASAEPPEGLAEQLSDAIAVAQDGRLVFVNAALAEYFGYPSAAALIGVRLEQFVTDHVPPGLHAPTLEWLKADAACIRVQEQQLRRLDGSVLQAECTTRPVGFRNKRATVYVWHDTALLRQAQARAARAERLTSLAKLAAGVAHEVNNPLAYMALNLDLALEQLEALRAEHAPGKAAEKLTEIELALNDVREGVRRVGRTIDGLNTLVLPGRSEGGGVELSAVLDAALSSIDTRLPPNTRIRRSYGAGAKVRGSEAWLERALHEVLLHAALALSSASGERSLGIAVVRSTTDRVRVTVEDSGPGIPPEILNRVFEPYHHAGSLGAGRGLGLGVAYGIVTSFGGTMELDSRIGGGTRVTLELPVCG